MLFTFFSLGCLIELKFCEVSRNSFSNRCWKFQLSILKNKKVLILKKYFLGRCQYKKKTALFTHPIFSEVFVIIQSSTTFLLSFSAQQHWLWMHTNLTIHNQVFQINRIKLDGTTKFVNINSLVNFKMSFWCLQISQKNKQIFTGCLP